MMFTRCGCRGDWLQLQLSCDSSIYDIGFTQYLTNLCLIQAIVRATVAPVIHIEANYIYQRTDMTGHLEFGRDFAVNQNCKKNYHSLATRPQRIRKEGTMGWRMLLCISCTSVVPHERMVGLRSAEMQNFSAVEC